MQKIFGILLMLVLIWAAIEVFTKGTGGAFGGVFASHSQTQDAVQAGGGVPDRVRDRVRSAVRTNEERTLQHVDP
ncbi:MAG TPA: hypothetical protein VKE73_05705 [Myxococcota bacterium]|nr:hypothetical protein [Myxococcota bacterium]